MNIVKYAAHYSGVSLLTTLQRDHPERHRQRRPQNQGYIRHLEECMSFSCRLSVPSDTGLPVSCAACCMFLELIRPFLSTQLRTDMTVLETDLSLYSGIASVAASPVRLLTHGACVYG